MNFALNFEAKTVKDVLVSASNRRSHPSIELFFSSGNGHF